MNLQNFSQMNNQQIQNRRQDSFEINNMTNVVVTQLTVKKI